MNSVNQTLYIPLYGKALVSRKGILLSDPWAENIWSAAAFPLKGKSKSKWLAYYMAMRAVVFDRWVAKRMDENPDATVLHLGCGLDSRVLRVGTHGHRWYDVDFPDVILARKRFFEESDTYTMLGADICGDGWLSEISGNRAIVILEGVSMYLTREALHGLLANLRQRFDTVELLMDCYTELAARVSKLRNPVHDVGVAQVYGLDEPRELESAGMEFVDSHPMTPPDLIEELQGAEKVIFRKLYAGKTAGKLYRIYEYRSHRP